MISIVTAIITVLGTFLIKKLTKSSSELDEKRFEIYKHLDFDNTNIIKNSNNVIAINRHRLW